MADKASVSPSNSSSRRWALLSSLTKRKSSRRSNKKSSCSSTSTANANNRPRAPLPDVPLAIWMSHVIPFLDRRAQDALVQVHKEVWLARTSEHTTWPVPGKITQFSRPVKSIAFVANNELWAAYCKSRVKRVDKLRGPLPKSDSGVVSHSRGAIACIGGASPLDSSIVATAGERDGSIQLWKRTAANDNKNQWTCFRALQVYQHRLRHMLWSNNGERIACWGLEGLLQVSNTADGALHGVHWKTRLEVAGSHQMVAFTPNSKSLLFARNNDFVIQWDFLRGEPVNNTLRVLPELQDAYGSHRGTFITGVAFSPNGKVLTVGCHVALLKIWNVVWNSETESYNYIYNRQIHLGAGWSAVALLTFSPGGMYIACTNQGSQIRIVDWDLAEHRDPVIATWTGHTGRIESLCFTEDGQTLASGSCDRTVRLWDMGSLPSPITSNDAA